jgi:hypothetical protein
MCTYERRTIRASKVGLHIRSDSKFLGLKMSTIKITGKWWDNFITERPVYTGMEDGHQKFVTHTNPATCYEAFQMQIHTVLKEIQVSVSSEMWKEYVTKCYCVLSMFSKIIT